MQTDRYYTMFLDLSANAQDPYVFGVNNGDAFCFLIPCFMFPA